MGDILVFNTFDSFPGSLHVLDLCLSVAEMNLDHFRKNLLEISTILDDMEKYTLDENSAELVSECRQKLVSMFYEFPSLDFIDYRLFKLKQIYTDSIKGEE